MSPERQELSRSRPVRRSRLRRRLSAAVRLVAALIIAGGLYTAFAPGTGHAEDTLREGGDVARGGELFRVNCSSCHAFSTHGGALSSGKYAPDLEPATDRQIYAAMLTGPQNMPVFGDNELTPQEKRDVIAYIQYQKADRDPGGWGLGRYGPVPEGIVIFVVGMVVLIFASLWIAGKS